MNMSSVSDSRIPGFREINGLWRSLAEHSEAMNVVQTSAMKTIMLALVLLVVGSLVLAENPVTTNESLNGEWQLTTIVLGIKSSDRLVMIQSGHQIKGSTYHDGEKVEFTASVDGRTVRWEFKLGNVQHSYVGTVGNQGMSGTVTMAGTDVNLDGNWTAQRMPQNNPASRRNLDFNPTEFHRVLSAEVPPVMKIWPGDTVHTKSVDAGGQDEKSVYRVAGGNPLTRPFYVEGAMPGDTVAITIKRLQLNRDWAMSDSGLVERALTADYASENKQNWAATRWHLDADNQIGTLENAPASLKSFSVKLRPMLGCVAVAPGPGDAPLSTQDSGDIGGNMDFSGVAQGTTVYLHVQQPGALVYLGDAHALQGEGELNGDALETSMDIEFSTDVLREKNIGSPRAENSDYLMAIGLSGSLDDAFRKATSELARWLQSDYKLSASEAAIVLGSSVEYTVSEVADRNVGAVAKIRKRALAALTPAK
jgi:amidase